MAESALTATPGSGHGQGQPAFLGRGSGPISVALVRLPSRSSRPALVAQAMRTWVSPSGVVER